MMGGGQPDSIAFGGVFTKIIEGRPPYVRALFKMLIEFVISVMSVIFVISLLMLIVFGSFFSPADKSLQYFHKIFSMIFIVRSYCLAFSHSVRQSSLSILSK